MRHFRLLLTVFGLLVLAVSGCSDDAARGSQWDVREQGGSHDSGAPDARNEVSESDGTDTRSQSEFRFEAISLATALDRMVFFAEHETLGYCLEILLVSPADRGVWDTIERPEGWAIEALTASGTGCSDETWPSPDGLEPIEASGVIGLNRTDGLYTGTITVSLSLRFPENADGIPRRVELESGEVGFECCG
jgi:hypothetical protein